MENEIGQDCPPFLMDSVVVLDTETGGLSPNIHSLLQIGLVGSRGRELVVNVNTPGVVTQRALEVNGIDMREHALRAMVPEKAVALIEAFLEGLRSVAPGGELWTAGHNVGFDIRFMQKLYELVGMTCPFDTYRSIDTKTLLFGHYARGKVQKGALSLGAACENFGVDLVGAHTAIGDARATRDLLVKLLHPGCHERDGLICVDTQVWRHQGWNQVNFSDLRQMDVFRMCAGGEWGDPYIANTSAAPEPLVSGPLVAGNTGLQATPLSDQEIADLGVAP